MQTVLGASGQIGRELALSLRRDFVSDIRLVSRRPVLVNNGDELVSADLLDRTQSLRAVEGSEIVYLTAGLPMNTQLWVEQWPVVIANVIDACASHGAKLVYFDNTYMYPQTARPQTEDTEFRPYGPKGEVRGEAARMLLDAMAQGRIELAGLLNQRVRDAAELLPRYDVDNIFVSEKFSQRFSDFQVTCFREGLRIIGNEN